MTPAGFPHSDISGSTPACDCPKLFAANHVLHRLLTPRHSPCALNSLVTNFPWKPWEGSTPPTFAPVGKASLRSVISEEPTLGSHLALVHRYFLYRDTPSTRSSAVALVVLR